MFKSFNGMMLAKYVGAVLLATAVFQTGSVIAEEELIGSDEYRISCLNCHGAGGKGDGPITGLLTKRPSDLTVLKKNNGGEYPFLRVYQTIDGRVAVLGHGERNMPIWGVRYLEDDAARYGDFGNEDVVRARILQLVYYIQNLQR